MKGVYDATVRGDLHRPRKPIPEWSFAYLGSKLPLYLTRGAQY